MSINMLSLHNSSINITFAILLLSMLLYWSSMAFPNIKVLCTSARTTLLTSNLILFTTISLRWVNSRHFPLSNLYESLLFLTWGMTFVNLILENKTKSNIIGALISPLSTLVIAFASLSLPSSMQKATALVPALKSNWLVMHVSVMMISYAILMVGTLLSILFLVLSQEDKYRFIKNIMIQKEQTSSLSASYAEHKLRLMDNLDNLRYRTIALGIPLLTVGNNSGAVWANEAWGSYWSWDPKETWALITWLVFASYLHSRITKGWQGKKAAMLASLGFVVVWICYLGVNFLGQGLHSYGWMS